jgi:DNA invertase Pin-like site-specific DNA recombinase
MIDFLCPGDTVVVWKLDRLSRSLKDLPHIMELIGQRQAGFRSLTEAVDTTAPAERMLMQLLGSFADYAEPGVMWSAVRRRERVVAPEYRLLIV